MFHNFIQGDTNTLCPAGNVLHPGAAVFGAAAAPDPAAGETQQRRRRPAAGGPKERTASGPTQAVQGNWNP
ncbi:MAG: hypothetical protein R6U98_26195 [Pirellulaceae bacterium]